MNTEATEVTKPNKREIAMKPSALVVQNTPDNLLAMAIDKDLDIEKLERLIALKERNDKAVARIEFITALGDFQGSCPPLIKNKKVGFDHKDGGGRTEYRYQELADIEKHVKPFLKETGLSYRWGMREGTKEEGNKIFVWCILTHRAGHEEVGDPMSGQPDDSGKKNDIQKKASTISYLRRYTLTGMLGIASGDMDDDGKGGQKNESAGKRTALKDEGLAGAIKSIMAGEQTVESIDKLRSLTPNQKSALEKAEKEFKAQKA